MGHVVRDRRDLSIICTLAPKGHADNHGYPMLLRTFGQAEQSGFFSVQRLHGFRQVV